MLHRIIFSSINSLVYSLLTLVINYIFGHKVDFHYFTVMFVIFFIIFTLMNYENLE